MRTNKVLNHSIIKQLLDKTPPWPKTEHEDSLFDIYIFEGLSNSIYFRSLY